MIPTYNKELQHFEYSHILRIKDKYKLNLICEWSDSYQCYILFNMDLKRSELLLYYIAEELKERYDLNLVALKNILEIEHQKLIKGE